MKKYKILLFCLVLFCLPAGCGKNEKKQNNFSYVVGKSKVCIYYPENNEIICDEELYQLRKPDSVAASVEEIMAALSDRMKKNISYHTYLLDEQKNLTLEFEIEGDVADEQLLLMKAAVAKTLFQLKDIGNIRFNLTYIESGDTDKSVYDKNSFYFYGYNTDMGLNKTEYRLYHANDEKTGLTSSVYTVDLEPYLSVEEHIIDNLESMKMIPHGTRMEAMSINAGVCHLKLSGDFVNQMPDINSELIVYSVVNSITSLQNIDKVLLSIDGVNSGTYRGSVDISIPLEFNEEIIK